VLHLPPNGHTVHMNLNVVDYISPSPLSVVYVQSMDFCSHKVQVIQAFLAGVTCDRLHTCELSIRCGFPNRSGTICM
jgi:hypothetical protein